MYSHGKQNMNMNWVTSKMSRPHSHTRMILHRLSLLMLLFLWVACNSSNKDAHAVHTADEHAAHRASAPDTSLADIVQAVNQTVISSQQTVKPIMQDSGGVLILNGYITEDPRRNEAVAVRIGGRIEKLYIKYNYQYIRKGEKILDLYSPALRTSQEEYLYLLTNKDDKNLISSARQKLLLLGLSESQINDLDKIRKVSLTLSIYSPHSGYIILRNTSPVMAGNTSEQATGMNMNESSSANSGERTTATAQTNSELREGMYVTAGQTLFTVNDFKKVWALLSIQSNQQAFIGLNTPVQIISEVSPQKSIPGKINLIEPVFREGVQFTQARIYLDNPGEALKANSLVSAEVQTGGGAILVVPNSSIADLGNRSIVWVKVKDTPSGKKVFEPRTVLTGIRTGGYTQILEGLKADELIAKQAGFLLDSESMIE